MTVNTGIAAGNSWLNTYNSSTARNPQVRSGSGTFGLALDSVILPTAQNVQKLCAGLSDSLQTAFQQAGIPTTPPVTLSVDPSGGHIHVSGDRPDTGQIEDLVNGDFCLAEHIRAANAISSQVSGMKRSLQFEREYMASDNPVAVVSKYSSLFGSPVLHSYALQFTGSAVQPLTDGQ